MRKMKDSGIEWIGEIPEDLSIIRNKYYLKYTKGKNPDNLNNNGIGVPYIGATDLDNQSKNISYTNYTTDDLPQCTKNDVLVLWDGARAGLIGRNHQGAISSTIVKVTPNEIIDTEFLYWYFKGFEKYLSDCVGGTTIPHMNRQYIEDIKMITWDIISQQKISAYLDSKCTEIDSVISKTKATIEEYKKLKQSVITQAVTKGIIPNRPMKDSGIEWIGEIPQEWEKIRIGRLFRLRNEKNYSSLDEVQLLSLYTGIGVFPHGEHEERGNRAVTAEGYNIVKKNDIVVNIILAWMGAIGISEYDGVTSPAYDVYIPDLSKVVPHYFHYVFITQGIAGECYKYGRGIMMMRWRTYSPEFKAISVPYPPIKEQQEIANYLDEKCSEIDKLIAKKEQLLTEMENYKKAVIYEYVTGKKEVE